MNGIFLLKNKIIFISIFLVAFILRFACINKVEGLWYDELVMYNQAVQTDFKSVISVALTEDVHLPLYQILLHYWGKIFNFSDFALRSFSAFCGLSTVVVSFFIGKKLKSTEFGLITMSLFAINSMLIYYSQEVRMYELLALFGTLNILALINLRKNIWYVIWVISSSAMILTYTISVIYILIEIVAYIIYKGKDFDKKFLISTIILLLINFPVIWYLLHFSSKFTQFITGFYADWSSLFVVVQNFFTPKLVGLDNNPPHYMQEFLSGFKFSDFVFVFLPLLISAYFIINSVKRSKFALFLTALSLVFFLVEIFAFVFTDFKILSRYLIVILPNLLIVIMLGIENNKKYLILFFIFLLINISYLIYSPNASFRMSRSGFLPLVRMLEQNNIQNGDIVVVWNRKDILHKYLDKKVYILSILKDFAYKSEVIFENTDRLNNTNEDGKKRILREYFKSDFVPANTVLLANYVIGNMQKGQKILITSHEYFNSFNHKSFVDIIDNDKDYNNMTYNNLMTTKSLLDFRLICDKNLTYRGVKIYSPYVLYVYEK